MHEYCIQVFIYRKNQHHRVAFSHPGDSDFESDPEDNRPSCFYGAGCYRRNSAHRRHYKHPKNVAPPPKRPRKAPKIIYYCNCPECCNGFTSEKDRRQSSESDLDSQIESDLE